MWLQFKILMEKLYTIVLPLQKNHIESTCDRHVGHMCSHVVHMCCFNFTLVPTCEDKISHVGHMWCPENACWNCVSHMWPTWAHMWPHVKFIHVCFYLLALRPHVEWTCEIGTTHKIHMWNSCDFSGGDVAPKCVRCYNEPAMHTNLCCPLAMLNHICIVHTAKHSTHSGEMLLSK